MEEQQRFVFSTTRQGVVGARDSIAYLRGLPLRSREDIHDVIGEISGNLVKHKDTDWVEDPNPTFEVVYQVSENLIMIYVNASGHVRNGAKIGAVLEHIRQGGGCFVTEKGGCGLNLARGLVSDIRLIGSSIILIFRLTERGEIIRNHTCNVVPDL